MWEQVVSLAGANPVTHKVTNLSRHTTNILAMKGEKTMARTPMVTRTIVTTKAIIMCLDVEAGEPFNKEVTLPRTYKDEKALLKKVKPLVETDTIKAVHVVDTEEVETLYGMTEQEFIENAQILPPRA